MKRKWIWIWALCHTLGMTAGTADSTYLFALSDEAVIRDIYEQLTDNGENIDFEELQDRLMGYIDRPININHTSYEELSALGFLSARQIDNLLYYTFAHPMTDTRELLLVKGLQDYEVRNLLPFVYAGTPERKPMPPAVDIVRQAKHAIIVRTDATNLEDYIRSHDGDPIAAQAKYRFNYANRIRLGLSLRRARGVAARQMGYSAYVCLSDIHCLQTAVLGTYQAQFGQGLVLSSPFHMGRNAYVLTAGMSRDDVRPYTSTDGAGMQGAAATLRFHRGKHIVSTTALYSLRRANDSTLLHTVGANITYRYNQLKLGFTAIANIYSDSLRYYYANAAYNQRFFRGDRQAVVGLNWRYNWGVVDFFGEAAAATNTHWGYGVETGLRIYPADEVGLILLYRYFSPYFDNTWGYGYTQSSRPNDENGLYLGVEVKRLRHWRFTAYGDLFRFAGVKYGIPYAPSIGYELHAQAEWIQRLYTMAWRFRAKEKGRKQTFALRYQYSWDSGGWHLRTQAEANIVRDSLTHLTYGYALHQDVHYAFRRVPLVLQARVGWFDARTWDNRIYNYENDVLYAYSIPALYGQGVRMYMNVRWKIIPNLSLYLRVSETIYTPLWRGQYNLSHPSSPRLPTDTDVHLLIRATL